MQGFFINGNTAMHNSSDLLTDCKEVCQTTQTSVHSNDSYGVHHLFYILLKKQEFKNIVRFTYLLQLCG